MRLRLLVGCLLSFACEADTSLLGDGSIGIVDASTTPVDASEVPADAGEEDASIIDCRDRARCETTGQECSNGQQRCVCTASGVGSSWFCESASCPQDVVAGESCSEPGLMCGAGFESYGSRCVGPENVWIRCGVVRGLPGEIMSWCPQDPPAIDAPCCVINPASRPDDCPYGQDRFRCSGDHWMQL